MDVPMEVLRLAGLAVAAGCHGIVCSGEEAAAVRDRTNGALAMLVPGIRPAGADVGDQVRVVTEKASAAWNRARVVNFKPIEAESLYLKGWLEDHTGKLKEAEEKKHAAFAAEFLGGRPLQERQAGSTLARCESSPAFSMAALPLPHCSMACDAAAAQFRKSYARPRPTPSAALREGPPSCRSR